MTSKLYSCFIMKKPGVNLIESVQPLSGYYSCGMDLRLNAWLACATALYVLDLLLVRRNPEWSAGVRAAFALAPLAPGMLYIRSWLRFIRGMDELQRRIQLEAWLFAAIGTVLAGIAVSTLNASGIHLGGLEHGMGIGCAFIVSFVLWLVGTAVASCRFK